MDAEIEVVESTDVVIVGAGFAGMYAIHKFGGLGFSVRCFDVATDVGGTWYWNRYPGARCDVQSLEYSYSFDEELQQEWRWSEKFAPQPEILSYANHVADRFELRNDITFATKVTSATFDESTSRWLVSTEPLDGRMGEHIDAQFVVMATGCLSSANVPNIAGLDSFDGDLLHTGRWPHEPVDLAGKRVGVVGTGSSGIQAIPVIAEQAEHLTVFQRTPNYTVPAHNRPLDREFEAMVKAHYDDFRDSNRQQRAGLGALYESSDDSAKATPLDEANARFADRWDIGGFSFLGAFGDLMVDEESNDVAAQFVRDRIADIVEDPAVATRLMPEQPIGCKRICVDTDYYATYNQPNVELIDVQSDPIKRITSSGIETSDSTTELDVIVFATGFDAMTGSILKVDIRGRGGTSIRDAWEAGPVNYLGLQVAGFPNLFTITGPGSPSVLTNMIVSIEHHVDWIADLLVDMREAKLTTIEPQVDAQRQWVEHVNTIASHTLFPTCNSWYLGANVPGKPRVFMPLLGFPDYVTRCTEVAGNNYEGFLRS